MGLDWNKKRIIQLNNADEQAVEQWLEEFIDVIYTWLYYHVGADASIAADLTTRTFKRAVQQLETFVPGSESMLQWLRGQAKEARDEGLESRQIKPQRPWAWSQLPDDVLCGLSHFRDEPLPENVANNPFVREMVQAALAEMEMPNRELMMHRYNHLEVPEHIAGEIGMTVQDVNDRLYRCRHFFRRVFVQLIQTANPGFSESTASGSLELLDVNLEKLLSATNMVQHVTPKEQARIREIVLEAARQNAPMASAPPHKKIAVIGIAAAVVVLVAVGITLMLLPDRAAKTPTPTPVATAPKPEIQPEKTTPVVTENKTPKINDAIDEDELKRVFALGQAGDLAGLLEILKTGQYTSQIAACHFIGKLGDEGAIGMLQEAEDKWYPDGSADNPFAQAIAEIQDRLLAESGAVVEEEPNTPQTPAAAETAKPEPAPTPKQAISGTVTDAAGQPIPDARITLSANPLYALTGGARMLDQTVTNDAGQYGFAKPAAQALIMDCKSPRGGLSIIRAVWCEKDAACQVDFGGLHGVYGGLHDDAGSVVGQMLCLSDTLDPADAAFRVQSTTDANGQFAFAGIPAGSYYLLNMTDAGRIMRLGTIDVAGNDITDWAVTVRQAVLTVQMDITETTPIVSGMALTYGADVPEQLNRFELEVQDDGTYLSEAIPFGSYTLTIDFENGMRLQQPLELNSDRTISLTVPEGTSVLSGRFTSATPYPFFLYNTDQRVRFDIVTDGAGTYAFDTMPPDTYTLAAVVNGLPMDFMQIDLQSEPDQVLDIDAGDLLAGYSPLYVVVTDAAGSLLNDAQVWVTGAGQVVTTQSTGRGAFLAIPQGDYTLYAALPGYSTAEQPITVTAMPLKTAPNEKNTIHLQLKSP